MKVEICRLLYSHLEGGEKKTVVVDKVILKVVKTFTELMLKLCPAVH